MPAQHDRALMHSREREKVKGATIQELKQQAALRQWLPGKSEGEKVALALTFKPKGDGSAISKPMAAKLTDEFLKRINSTYIAALSPGTKSASFLSMPSKVTAAGQPFGPTSTSR